MKRRTKIAMHAAVKDAPPCSLQKRIIKDGFHGARSKISHGIKRHPLCPNTITPLCRPCMRWGGNCVGNNKKNCKVMIGRTDVKFKRYKKRGLFRRKAV
jgi:hypothetical protein